MDKILQTTAVQMAEMERRPYFVTYKNKAIPADDFSLEKHGRIALVIYPPGYQYRWSHGIDYSQWKRDPLMGWVWRGWSQ